MTQERREDNRIACVKALRKDELGYVQRAKRNQWVEQSENWGRKIQVDGGSIASGSVESEKSELF